MNEDLKEEKISSTKIFEGGVIGVRKDQVKLPDGNTSIREVVDHSGGITLIPLIENSVLMVEQYRYPTSKVLLELPAGKLEEGEEPEECAQRELQEETGYKATKLEYLFSFYTSPGFSNEFLHLYQAEDLKEVDVEPEEGEFLRLRKVALDNVLTFIKEGKIVDGKSIIGLLSVINSRRNQ